MIFKSKVQPLCRYCGVKIKKRTEDIYVYDKPPRTHSSEGRAIHVSKHVIGNPRTKAEAQKLVNMLIVSVQRSLDGDVINRLGVWDGESYQDEYFCTGKHAQWFGYQAAYTGMATKAYNDAILKRGGK